MAGTWRDCDDIERPIIDAKRGTNMTRDLAAFIEAEIYRCCLHDLKDFRTRAELEQSVRSFVTKVLARTAIEKAS